MTCESRKAVSQPGLTDTQVAAWLLDHPDFFVQHSWLLEHLTVPHECGEAVSLIERQVALLRQTNHDLCHQIENLVHIARINDALLANMHHLTLALLEAGTLSEAVTVVEEALEERFQVEWVTLRFFQRCPGAVRSDLSLPEGSVEPFLPLLVEEEPYIGRPDAVQKAMLFPGEEGIRSWALVPLGSHDVIAILAIGSSDEERFCPGLGRVFLKRLGEVIGTRLETLLRIEEASGEL